MRAPCLQTAEATATAIAEASAIVEVEGIGQACASAAATARCLCVCALLSDWVAGDEWVSTQQLQWIPEVCVCFAL